MGGEILLGRLDQLHGLPCRVLAILGLQDGAFPRAARRPAWDLLAYQPERFDSDPRIQDRQWFLDSLLAPKDRLILSAANRSLRTAHDGPLSSVIEELVRVAADTVRPTDGWDTLAEQLVVRHRIQPLDKLRTIRLVHQIPRHPLHPRMLQMPSHMPRQAPHLHIGILGCPEPQKPPANKPACTSDTKIFHNFNKIRHFSKNMPRFCPV
jgi:exonuclease V gamma subunit